MNDLSAVGPQGNAVGPQGLSAQINAVRGLVRLISDQVVALENSFFGMPASPDDSPEPISASYKEALNSLHGDLDGIRARLTNLSEEL